VSGEKILDLAALLPHRPPMILLDEAVDYGDDFAVGRVTIQRTSRFFDARLDAMPAWVGIEYMAQSIGIWAGAQRLSMGEPVQLAFLLGTRSYRSNVPAFPAGSRLTVHIDVLYSERNSLGSFGCRIEGGDGRGGFIEVTARINAFSPENPEEFAKSKT